MNDIDRNLDEFRPNLDENLDEILANTILDTGAKLTEIGWEKWGENLEEAKHDILALMNEARIDELKDIVLPDMRLDEYGYSKDENDVGYNSALQTIGNRLGDRIAELTKGASIEPTPHEEN